MIVNNSKRPRSIKKLQSTLAKSEREDKFPSAPSFPKEGPTLPMLEADKLKEE